MEVAADGVGHGVELPLEVGTRDYAATLNLKMRSELEEKRMVRRTGTEGG